MDVSALAAFAAAFLVFAASPGPDNMTIAARTISHGASLGLAYGAGTAVGILVFLGLSALGLSVVASELGFVMVALRYGGAVWLVWMGLQLWRAEPVLPRPGVTGADRADLASTFATGIALNLGNPKMPLFYLALLPQVIGPTLSVGDVIRLAGVILVVEVLVVGGHVLLAVRARRLLTSAAAVRRVNRASGGVMIGAGVAVAVAR